MALQSLDIVRLSATTTPMPSVRQPITGSVAKLIDTTKCIGCKACQAACMEWNDLRGDVGVNVGVYDNPADLDEHTWTLMRFSEYENPNGNFEWLIRKDGCMHCEDPGCLKACPSPGAIVQYANGIVDFHEEACIGCGYCVAGCPFNIPRISKTDHKAYKCTLCSDRVAVGQEPACVKTCPTGAIVFGTKTDMIQHAEERIVDLKSRGFDQAGLYDPAGVGGTHVMYVLHHADQPKLYHDLPEDPKISPLVSLWKGIAKPLAVAGMAFAALAGFFHYIRVGPNETGPEDEAAAEDEIVRWGRDNPKPQGMPAGAKPPEEEVRDEERR
ncbi:formate dehydrogenase subunit beta [Cupriavidus plantarum]|uniref:Formate dehydrogenase (Quinone-dependent) iron-sulfur subunit n=1 Tax=Cupriavidus plantarum TaxID=942865 RepID=A0A316ETS7_9BURK|nr:formate dehydrogenase subunit beta [Cupriavidus plantarum]PWK34975.1 formate dehydrogenase (quinone-dependent) iron-sulfur subunit [Cupriavidus plantarum]REE93416.1 formate dehydrogenase (quinone-dependent) iron-sulfur subunit [Cupriavidus plantarum]RLK38848.1 formate dehydrogenase (quinone-dependent) iron-sulfur subunit [Cupriavidus plantarum]CAG2136896.1 Formate dehydrogenase, nitrate-inducible, iron-sulfur subunit [Cupriavidus plantarum]SMR84822.1 formate dehydrogenase (quinone-dependent